jgi:Bacterial Ig-like domain (group 3)/FG-GAP-like repeat
MSATPWLNLLRNTPPLVLVLFSTLLPVISSAQTQPPLFPTTSFVDAGAQVLTATGDFNGDGQQDLVTLTPNQGASIVTALLYQGDTTPSLAVTTAVNLNAVRLLAVDMNNDKKLDLVTNAVSGGSAGIAVLFGNGDGTFQSPVFYPIVAPGNIVAVDLNGDGYPDLAFITAPTLTALKVVVLLNQGSSAPGTLSTPTSYPLSITFAQTGPLNIGAADFNGDGKQDILVGGTNLAVFYGQGDGTLQSQQSPVIPTGPGGAYFVASDLNHDGISDVAYIAAGISPLSLQVLLGHSNGTFTVGSNLPLSLSNAFPIALVSAGATNGGTNINLAAVSDKTTILLGDGNGNFSQGPSYAINGTPFPVLNSSGKTDLFFELFSNLVSSVDNKITRLIANGDVTFQGVPTLPVGPFGFVAADFNGDGLTDVLSVDPQNHLITGLGRGNGTFTVTNSVSGAPAKLLVTADFNADGNPDAAILTPGDSSTGVHSTLVLYKGNGDGSFQPSAAPVDLQVAGAISAITGDFNGDGTADVAVAYSNTTSPNVGLVFLPGKGDGTFGTAIPLAPETFSPIVTPLLLAADLNNDHKLDLLWNRSIYLGNGDGTFHKSTVPLPGPVLAVGDLNGDGIPDVVIGASVYAGNGDGTFHSSPLYTATLPSYAKVELATIADSNADSSPDLLFQCELTGPGTNTTQAANTYLTVFLGDGKGNFTADSNNYYAGNFNNAFIGIVPGLSAVASMAVPARLNNQAPKGIAQDYLTWTNGGATALLNQTNPTPTAPSPLPSKTSLTASLSNATTAQQITFTAAVSGIIPASAPSGTVTFTSGGTTLGTATILNGVASANISFPAAGTYPVIASYAGDSNNAPSSSAALSITIARVAVTIDLAASTLTPGANQPLTFSVSFSPIKPTGTVTFSISGGATLGTAPIVQGIATFPYAFPAAGNYSVIASFPGDAAALPVTSSPLSITVLVPNFTFSATGALATISAGQSATTTLNALSQNGYHGTISLSCTSLAAGEACTFSPATLTPQADGPLVSSTISISTTAPTAAHLRGLAESFEGIAWASLLCVTLSPRRGWRLNRHLMRASMLTFLLAIGLIHLSGCSSSPSPSTPQNTGTPKGTQTITVTASDSVGGPSHSISLQLTVQ